MPSSFAWLFNNDRDSDALVVISTADAAAASGSLNTQREQERASDEPLSADAPVQSSSEGPTCIATRTLYGHMVVLNSYSDYFRTWSSKTWQSNGRCAGSKRKHSELEEDVPKAYIHVATADLVPVAEAMVKFMYTEEVEQSTIGGLLQLLKLADEYGVIKLIDRTVHELRQSKFDAWAVDEMLMMVVGLPQCVQANAAVNGFRECFETHLWLCCPDLKATADNEDGGNNAETLIEWMLSQHLDLNEALSDEVKYKAFQTWPAAAVVSLLSRDDLQVPSENIVMVAVKSWLESNITAPADEKVQVMQQLRLPQLSPCMIALLIRESRQEVFDQFWLPGDTIERLVYYLRADSAARERLHQLPLCNSWGTKRQGCAGEGTFKISFSLSEMDGAVQQLRRRPNQKSWVYVGAGRLDSQGQFIDGLHCFPIVKLYRGEDGAVGLLFCIKAEAAVGTKPPASLFRTVSRCSTYKCASFDASLSLTHRFLDSPCVVQYTHTVNDTSRFVDPVVFGNLSTLNQQPGAVRTWLANWLQEDGQVGCFEMVFKVSPGGAGDVLTAQQQV